MRTYQQTRDELFDLQKYAIKLGLDNIRRLTDLLEQPQKAYPVIHVAGTNGKGGTAFYTALILRSYGLRVGLFTSPHLKDYRERIRVDDVLIDENFVVDFWERVRETVLALKATFFDTTTLMALDWFRVQQVDVAVIETGLGGRLDSTNIVEPGVAVITPIDFDHQKQLGNTLTAIAAEKAGIIKDGAVVCLATQKPQAKETLLSAAGKNPCYYLPDILEPQILNMGKDGIEFKLRSTADEVPGGQDTVFLLPTLAAYQVQNFSLAWLAASLFVRRKRNAKQDRTLLKKYLRQKSWPGRLQVVAANPPVIHDVSHNFHGISQTIVDLQRHFDLKTWTLLLGMVNDKDAEKIIAFLSGKFGTVYISEPPTHRRQDGAYLTRLFETKGQKAIFIKDLREAYEISKMSIKKESGLLVMGSHYLIGAL